MNTEVEFALGYLRTLVENGRASLNGARTRAFANEQIDVLEKALRERGAAR